MSYCRFSSDDFQSDAYIYEGRHGFVFHLAGNRLEFPESLPEPVEIGPDQDEETFSKWVERHRLVTKMVATAERKMIDLPDAGASLEYPSLEELLEAMEHYRSLGYRIPEHAFERVQEEMAEESAK